MWQSGDVVVFWDNGDHTLLIGGDIDDNTVLELVCGDIFRA